MISTSDLQVFLGKIQNGTIPVDLLKIGQQHSNNAVSGETLFFIIEFLIR